MSDRTTASTIDAAGLALVAELARSSTHPTILNFVPPNGMEGVPINVPAIWDNKAQRATSVAALLEEYRRRPERRTGTAKVDSLKSFIDLVKRHATPERSVIFARTQMPEPHLLAVIDYHGTDHTPSFGHHRVRYAFPLTDEFKAWLAHDGKALNQAEFASFLEEHAAELASAMDAEKTEFERLFKARMATPADVLTLSRELEIAVGRKVKNAIRLQTGEATVEFVEEHTTKGEKVDIPGIFMVAVPAFIDGQPVRMPARLRYRVAQGDIVWFYQLYRPNQWLREQVVADLDVAQKETALPAFEGAPEASA